MDYNKEDCLEVVGASHKVDIENAYKQAVKENKKYYVAISGSGKRYAWKDNGYYELPAGEFAENDKYVEPVIEAVEIEEPVVDEVAETVEAVEPVVEVVETEPVVEAVEVAEPEIVEKPEVVEEPVVEAEEPVDQTDYKALYEKACEDLDKGGEQINALIEEINIKNTAIETLKAELDKVTAQYENYKAETEIVKNFFRA